MSNKSTITKEHVKIMRYLNDLQESGATNMFGASPYIQTKFGLDKDDAKVALRLWMDNYDEDGNYDTLLLPLLTSAND